VLTIKHKYKTYYKLFIKNDSARIDPNVFELFRIMRSMTHELLDWLVWDLSRLLSRHTSCHHRWEMTSTRREMNRATMRLGQWHGRSLYSGWKRVKVFMPRWAGLDEGPPGHVEDRRSSDSYEGDQIRWQALTSGEGHLLSDEAQWWRKK